MSAKNWTTCPQCASLASQEQAKLRGLAEAAYGNVSREEYAELVRRAEAELVVPETLREDWRVGIETDGTFQVGYLCLCEVCGFTHKFKEQYKVPLEEC